MKSVRNIFQRKSTILTTKSKPSVKALPGHEECKKSRYPMILQKKINIKEIDFSSTLYKSR